ncbi:hypothetical protein R4B61_03230 [Fructilactobacillus vespulae]|uniref:hypothetical protein n=1 Tax=Fructilactobacillus vespulae TaxID=1249630 RepID=UPI0039B39F60
MEKINLESVNQLISESDFQNRQLIQKYQSLQNVIKKLEQEAAKIENGLQTKNKEYMDKLNMLLKESDVELNTLIEVYKDISRNNLRILKLDLNELNKI